MLQNGGRNRGQDRLQDVKISHLETNPKNHQNIMTKNMHFKMFFDGFSKRLLGCFLRFLTQAGIQKTRKNIVFLHVY